MFKRLRNLLFGSLRRQLIIGVALTITAVMALFMWGAIERQRALLLERQSEYAVALAQSVATSSAGWLQARDFYGLQEIIYAQRRYPELVYAMILDLRGRIVAHSDPARLNQFVLDLPKIDAGGISYTPYIVSRGKDLVDALSPVVLSNHQIGWVRVGLGQQTLNARLAGITRDGLVFAAAAILIGSVLVGIMGWRLTRRLYVIRQASDAIQAGDSRRRARLDGVDEAAGLARAFDDMLDTLAARDQALRLATERLQVATRAGIIGIWDWDVVKRELIWDDVMCRLYGIRHDQFAGTYDAWLSRLHAEDRSRVDQNIQEALRGEREYGLEFRVVWPDGSIRYLKAASQTIRDQSGQPLRMVGINYDLTERKQAEAELEQHRHHLEQLVRERTEQLERARDTAESANRAKSVFLSNMSHELRTPLNAILGFAQLMERDQRLPADVHHNLETINRAGRHLLALINDVLDISRIEAGRTTVQNAEFDLNDTLTGIEEMIRLRAEHKGLSFSVEHSGQLPRYVYGDANHLRQVLINLLGNAVKYTEQGRISLRLTPGADSIRFEVSDSGPGIATNDLERIFQPFYQTESGVAKGEGTGLGLTISREYVRLMGGELHVQSELQHGSVFSFSLPLPEADVPLVESRQRRVLGLEPGHPAVRILVAEDNPDNQELIASLLASTGFEVRLAGNGRRAIEIFQDWQPHFIWMDMRMPVLDGYQATQAIRALPGGNEVKIVALTASAFHEDRAAILAVGCDDMLAKPIDETRLYLLMGDLLGLRYRYADQAVSASAPSKPGNASPADLTTLPEPLRAELQAAAELLDTDAVRTIVDGMLADYPQLARLIGEWMSDYRFEKIIELCRRPEEDQR
ncbi:PAS domain-containing protein [Methylomonas sp. LL1]|uniref:ATP-binding protein n=1 Tax=Methylomonas sp. LL1 TaxID=2785785 RepID=UPI0018C36F1E|nr:ATP-binding protein [Methylomonas sp. LL1]QPK61745.1 PAS domain-containing protein [Methylomonas sp. LL1]